MAGSSVSPSTTQRQSEIPPQRTPPGAQAAVRMTAVRAATGRLTEAVAGLDERAGREPSLLPGWTRAHVLSHLCRNADALVNLLTWARTGIEHPMYASRADRDADIEEGSRRLVQVIREDLLAAAQRFESAAGTLAEAHWQAMVAHPVQGGVSAVEIPTMRLFEVCVHLVDLDAGVGFAELDPALVESLLGPAVRPNLAVDGGPTTRLDVQLADGRIRSWELNADGDVVRGSAAAALGWLTGRTPGTGMSGTLPALVPWG